MGKYLKESMHWLHLLFLKPSDFWSDWEVARWNESINALLKALPVGLIMILIMEAIIGGLCELVGYPFSWPTGLKEALKWCLASGLGFGVFVSVVSIWENWREERLISKLGRGFLGGMVFGLAYGLVGALVSGVIGGLNVGVSTWLVFGINTGLFCGLLVWSVEDKSILGLGFALVTGLFITLLGGIFGLAAFEIFNVIGGGQTQWLNLLLGYFIAFLFTSLRPFYILPHIFQYCRARIARDPFKTFGNSPVYWDEAVILPLPFLTDWLVSLVNYNRDRGLAEIRFVEEERPLQARAARRARRVLAIQQVEQVISRLKQASSMEQMAKVSEILKSLPPNSEYLPRGLEDVQRRIRTISTLAQDYLTRATSVGQSNVLKEMRQEVEAFRDAMTLVEPTAGTGFQTAASRWLEVITKTEAGSQKRLEFTPIPNPFIAGNPLQQRDHDLFKGRKDIIVAIEKNIINSGQRPALLLYGRRRTGKSSTLLNLPRLLSSQFMPVYIDCQDAKWRDGNPTFSYNLAAAIHGDLYQRDLHDGLPRPALEQFEKYTFTRLDEYLDRVEQISRRTNKRILLTFDEYERMELGIKEGRITEEIFNKIRNIVQHRERIVVLFSGSHRFEEMKTVNWSDYLINTKMLEISFLDVEDARELVTHPVAGFNLQYEPGVVERILKLTHCQPYLLQALASDLVDSLNEEKRTTATDADLEIAIEETLISAQLYFAYIWTEECSQAERDVLLALAANAEKSFGPASALQSLIRKEIVERSDDHYRISVDLFRRWILKNQLTEAKLDLLEESQLQIA